MKTKLIFILIIVSSFIISCKHADQALEGFIEIEYPNELGVVKRADWGWVPIDTSYKTQEVNYITIHHGGVEFTRDKDPVKSIQNLQSWSRSEKKWIDIPYHYMIDLDGIIYEGRPINIPGDTNTEYDPTNHALIEVMGNYEIQTLSEDQLKALIDLMKFLKIKYNVPLDNIKSHKDYSSMTVCPGKDIYKYFENGYIKKALIE